LAVRLKVKHAFTVIPSSADLNNSIFEKNFKNIKFRVVLDLKAPQALEGLLVRKD
jgi:hypothetical protein